MNTKLQVVLFPQMRNQGGAGKSMIQLVMQYRCYYWRW